jgi:hypothetical protein
MPPRIILLQFILNRRNTLYFLNLIHLCSLWYCITGRIFCQPDCAKISVTYELVPAHRMLIRKPEIQVGKGIPVVKTPAPPSRKSVLSSGALDSPGAARYSAGTELSPRMLLDKDSRSMDRAKARRTLMPARYPRTLGTKAPLGLKPPWD